MMMKLAILSLLSVLLTMSSFAGESKKINCVFETSLGKEPSASSYVTQYNVKGVITSEGAMLLAKRTEFGVAKIGDHFMIDRSNVFNKDLTDVPYRAFSISPKNTNPNWKTYVVKTPVGDGYVAAVSLTLSNIKVSGENYGNSYKAVFSLTTIGDESNYTQKTPGLCSIEK